MRDRPLLIFPRPQLARRNKRSSGPTKLQLPSHARQCGRLMPQFKQLQRSFDAKCAELRGDPSGAVPEQVLILETVGTIENFVRAVKRTPGMEWLGELDEEDIPPDDNFFQDDEHRDNPLSGRLFLVMVNQEAMEQLQSLWKRYKKNPTSKFVQGLNKWRDVFKHLRNIRPWDERDRLKETGILEDWRQRVENGQVHIPFEIELWFRGGDTGQEQQQKIFDLLNDVGGQLISQTVIPEIAYHGLLVQLPIKEIQTIVNSPTTRLLCCDQVMFFRPLGQAAVKAPKDKLLQDTAPPEGLPKPQGDPIVALLDGLPLANHLYLEGRLILDDPDEWDKDYPSHERHHGTEMASLIVHGELDFGEQPLKRPLYVRPILKPDHRDWGDPKIGDPRIEMVPENLLPVDLVHRAVRRLFDGEGPEPPKAPSVRIINFSVGDSSRLFYNSIGPWARLLDWLAYHYKVLFVVSAGNHYDEIVLEVDRTSLSKLTPEELETAVLKSIANNMRSRRLLTPAEAVNVLTVGAVHEDSSTPNNKTGYNIDVFHTSGLPSPLNALGLGYRRAVKPDFLMQGGRQLYLEKLGNTHTKATLRVNTACKTGQRTATPGKTPGNISATHYTCGTSNATALTSRIGAKLYELIEDIRQTSDGELLEERFTAVLLKTMLVHGSRWGNAYSILEGALRTPENSPKFREYAARFFGYGVVEPNRVYTCTDQRATILGCNALNNDRGHLYTIPLPPSLSGQRIWRRLTITLAWMTPINPFTRTYRCASLWFDPPAEKLILRRKNVDSRATQRGTVQHEVLEGEDAVPFIDGEVLQIQVNCRADAVTTLREDVPYGIAVTLEVAEGSKIPIYEEIRTRIRLPVTITPVN